MPSKRWLELAVTHDWDVTPREAREIQESLRGRVSRRNRLGGVRYVAGLDVAFEQRKTVARGAVVLLSLPTLEVVESHIARLPLVFPYVPGLLSFREVPVLLEALRRLSRRPDLLLCDGQGFAHPRRFGLACHLGVLTELPAVGVAKSRLIGEHGPVPEDRGAWTDLTDRGERIGAVLRSRPGVRPLYVSSGHRIDLPTAVRYVMRCATRYRLPEPTRLADRLSKASKTAAGGL